MRGVSGQVIKRDKLGRFIKGNQPLKEWLEKSKLFTIGHTPWNKGKYLPEEMRKKIGLANKGKKHKPSRNYSYMPRGKNHYKWCGGITGSYAALKSSDEYKEWRFKVLKRDDYTCVICGKVGGKLHVHHIKSFSKYPKLRLVVSNGITVCKDCHLYKIHKWEPKYKLTIIIE